MALAQDVVGGTVESLTKVIDALRSASIELIGDNEISQNKGRRVRLVERKSPNR